MDGKIQEIFNYLPINKNPVEAEYINHLWKAVISLENSDDEGTPFLIMPFHLLFMLSIQYKVIRIFKYETKKYNFAFLVYPPRNGEKELLDLTSVFTLGILEESNLINLLKIVNIPNDLIGRIKALVKNRNKNLAHAKGGIERNLEQRISEYIFVLNNIQKIFEKMNDKVATKWLKEMGTGQEGSDYIELHLAEEYLCPEDMQSGKLSILEKRLNGEM